jgi:serine/threonine-protein kinase
VTSAHQQRPDEGELEKQVDLLCDAFEKAWLTGKEAVIEAFLARGASNTRTALLRELLLAEWGLRERGGDPVAVEDYRRRFPDHKELISELWAQRRREPDDLLFSDNIKEPAAHPSDPNALASEVVLIGADDSATDRLVERTGSQFRSLHGQFLPGTRLAGRYRIVSLMGKGGMGEVYRADDLKLGHTVALKFLPKEFAERPHRLENFLSEVRLARQIAHPNVCRVYDIGEVGEHHFLSMEFIDGEDLKGLLRRIGRLPKDKGIEIAQQLCAGLAAAHDLGVLHRDLKPANIMLDGRGQVRITDFGLARLATEGTAAEVAGTPAYMAPEQLTRGETTIQSDLYSLGLVLYEMFTGQRAHKSSSAVELLREHDDAPPEKPSAFVNDLDPAVERAILRCLEKEPHERPPSARALAAALPGADALTAALATGQTPSPELVAHAAGTAGLEPWHAIACLAAAVLMLIGIAQINTSTKVFPGESPGWLWRQSAKLLEELGHNDLPVNSVARYESNKLLVDRGAEISKAELEQSQWPSPYRYWRRWSPGSLEPSHFHRPERVRLHDPPQALPNSASVVLDSSGRLLELFVVPEVSPPARGDTEPNWTTLLKWAQIDRWQRAVTQPVKTPPVYCDTIAAWRVTGPTEPGEDFVAQAGAMGGRPMYFELVGVSESFGAPRETGAAIGWALVFGSIFVAATVLAWHNVRQGRADRKSAFRCAMFVLAACTCLEVLAIRVHEKPAAIHIIGLLWDRAGGHIAIHAVHVWVLYLAIEPYVRRIWPRMLVGWVRLVSGRPRDPLVGREILLGTVIGVALGAVGSVTDLVAASLGMESSGPILPEFLIGGITDLSGPRKAMITAVLNLHSSLLWILVYASIVLVCRLLIKRDWVSLAAAAVLICVSLLTSVGRAIELPAAMPAAVAISVAVSIAIVLTITRVGLLTALCALVMFRFAAYSPISTDFTEWYGPYSLVTFVVVCAIGGYGFFIAMAGQPGLSRILAVDRSPKI